MRNSYRVLWALLIFLVACSQEDAGSLSETAVEPTSEVVEKDGDQLETAVEPTPEVVIVGPTDDYPEGCHPGEVADLLLTFFAAYNAADMETLDQTFASSIEWYADGKGGVPLVGEPSPDHFTAYIRDDMFPYIAERQAQHDHLQLLWLSIVPKTWHGGVDFVFALRRQADDLAPGSDGETRIGMGRGALRCPRRKIFVWSIAMAPVWEQESDFVSSSCAGSQDLVPEGKVIVCAHASQ